MMDSTKQRFVSVIIPCFNMGHFLLEAIQSVEVCPKSSYELIIVDDGSTEPQTLEILARLEKQGYHLIRQSNKGLAAARNAGINAARSPYILPLDADNKIRPAFLEEGMKILEQFPDVGVVYGDAEFFGDKTGVWRVPEFEISLMLVMNQIDACAVYRKKIWEQTGGYDSEMPQMGYEDWDFWLKVYTAGWRFYHTHKLLFDYRVRKDSMVTQCLKPENEEKSIKYIYGKHHALIRRELKNIADLKKISMLKFFQKLSKKIWAKI